MHQTLFYLLYQTHGPNMNKGPMQEEAGLREMWSLVKSPFLQYGQVSSSQDFLSL